MRGGCTPRGRAMMRAPGTRAPRQCPRSPMLALPLRALLPLLLSACAAGELPDPPDEPAPAPEQAAAPRTTPVDAIEPGPAVVAAEPSQPPKPAGPVEGPDGEKFSQAAALRDRGDLPGMRAALLALLRDHPRSPLVPHAYLMLGEE